MVLPKRYEAVDGVGSIYCWLSCKIKDSGLIGLPSLFPKVGLWGLLSFFLVSTFAE